MPPDWKGFIDLDDVYYDNKSTVPLKFSGSEFDLYNQGENADYLGNRTPYKDSDGSSLGVDEDSLPDNEDAKYRGLNDKDRTWWTDWGFDQFKDTSFAKEYGYLKDQKFWCQFSRRNQLGARSQGKGYSRFRGRSPGDQTHNWI